MTYVIRPDDRAAFKRCRRAWDFSSPARENYAPVGEDGPPDVDRALRDALAVYYFPGMWEWDRAIVRPLAVDGFTRSLATHGTDLSGDEAASVTDQKYRARTLLDAYFGWAPMVDDFVPVRVETDFSVRIPDPADPQRDLCTPAGEPFQYEGRIDMLVVDPHDNYWMVEHRTVRDGWTDLELLLLEERSTSFCWAWELFYLGMEISGVIYNELALGEPSVPRAETPMAPSPSRSGGPRHRRMYVRGSRDPGPTVSQQESPFFRRTRIRRSPAELEQSRDQMAQEALDMVGCGSHVYPNPSVSNCGPCAYRQPCLAVSRGTPLEEAMSGYRRRPAEELREGRLGGVTWSIGRGAAPPKFGGRR